MMKAQMQKISSFVAFFVAGSIYLSFTDSVLAKQICPTGDFANLCNLRLENNPGIFGNLVTVLLVFAVILSLIFLLIGAIRWITSGGDKGKLDEARKGVLASIVGLVIAFLAFFFLNLITYIFTGTAMTTLRLPTIVP